VTRRQLLTGLIVAIVLVSATPTAALAGDAPRTVLLDRSATDVATVAVDGQRYEVYRHDNVVPYASGIEIYADGERVTDPGTAEAVLTALAERRAVRELDAGDLATLRATGANASATASNLSAAATAVDATLASLREARTARAGVRTAYDAAVEAAPGIAEFNESARDVLPEFGGLENDTSAYGSNATRLAEMLERRRSGADVDPGRLYARDAATLEAKDELADEFGYGGPSRDLARLAAVSGAAASNLSTASVPRANRTARQLRAVRDGTAAAANGTAALEESLSEFELDRTRDRAESLEERWMRGWRSRRNAGADVYRSLAVAGAVVLGGIGYVGWRAR
jgi:hypothetical protein